MNKVLKTGSHNARNVPNYVYGADSLADLGQLLTYRRAACSGHVVFFIDHFFEENGLPPRLHAIEEDDLTIFVNTKNEPTTTLVNELCTQVLQQTSQLPIAIVGVGGGATMDVAKAVSNLLTNGGKAQDYQGWDLVRVPGVFKIGIPTLSGTGAESTRTCVMTDPANGLKLGMNSDFTVFDQIILDPELTATVPRNQYLYTGMDAYLHCMESLNGSYRNAIGDAYSAQTIRLCQEVFLSNGMMGEENRAKMMVASYLGGCAIATGYVGVVHPFSAGLSVVLGIHHCVGNCIVMRAMEEFYPEGYKEFWQMVDCQGVQIPEGVCRNLAVDQYDRLFTSTVVHEKPLVNALGEDCKRILTREKIEEIFRRM